MTDITMTVVGADITMVDMAGATEVELGNAPGTDDFLMPNDGQTVLIVHAVTGDTLTFTAVECVHGRTETAEVVIAAGDIAVLGPFDPELWNESPGVVRITPTANNAADLYYAKTSKAST